jgi:hypothetical protein
MQGRKMGRGLEHFFKVGATVKNERFTTDWQPVGETACFRAEKLGVLGTKRIIEAINEKCNKAQGSRSNDNPLTF